MLAPDVKNQLKKSSEILTFHIRSVSKERLVRKIGQISDEQVAQIKKGFDEIWRY